MEIKKLTVDLSVSQYFDKVFDTITLKGEKIPESFKQYSNISNSSLYKDLTYQKAKRVFIADPIKRNETNCYDVIFNLGELSIPSEKDIDISKVIEGIFKIIERISPRSKFNTVGTRDINWKYPVIVKIKCENIQQDLVEGKYPFSDTHQTQLKENVITFFNQLGIINQEVSNKTPIDYKTIKWNEVTLADGKIYFYLDQKLTVIPCAESNAHLQQLKQILFRRSPSGLKLSLHSPYEILEPEVFSEVIKFLEVNYKLSNKLLAVPEFQQEIWKSQGLQQILGTIFSKDSYLDYLIKTQELNLPIIPVIELNNQIEEPSYIFTIKKKSSYKIIWESTLHGRATYLFKATVENYKVLLQNIYDYIKSDLLLKRKGIKDYEQQLKLNGKNLCFIGRVKHSSFDSWLMNLQEKLDHY